MFPAVLAALASLAGCKDFLTEHPTENLFSTQIYANRETAYTAVIGCYSMLVGGYYAAPWTETIQPSSIFVCTGQDVGSTSLGAGALDLANMARFNIDPNHSGVSAAWSGVYAAISRCNTTIAGIEQSSGISDDDKSKLLGEVRFLRGFNYFNVVRTWGRAPMPMIPPTTIADAHQGRVGVDTLFRTIIDDLKYAEANMPTKAEQVWGKPCNTAATAFLAKVYAAMASSSYGGGGSYYFVGRANPWADSTDAFWNEAYNYAKKVYDSGTYSLVPDYNDLWMARTKNTSESIFEIQFNAITSPGNNWAWGTYVGFSMFTPNSTTNNNGNRIKGSRAVYNWQVAKYTAADPRMNANYIMGGYFMSNPMASTYPNAVWIFPTDTIPGPTITRVTNWPVTFPCLKKYFDPAWTSGATANINWPVYRYDDLILTLAEAANEIGRPKDEVVGYVNEVLQRARNSGPGGAAAPQAQPAPWDPNDPALATQEGMREAIMRERLFEMPCEGQEWFDVRRRGVAWFKMMAEESNTELLSHQYSSDVGRVNQILVPTDTMLVRKFLFFPIPQTEINANWAYATNKDQNFGY